MIHSTLAQYELKLLQLLSQTHHRLNQRFPFIQDSRQLSNQQNQLLSQLNNQTPQYKILVAAMAIDTYSQTISQIFDEADTLLQILSICLSCAQKMKNQMKNMSNSSETQITFQNLYNSLLNMIESASLFNPISPYLQVYRSVLSDQSQNLAQNIYSSLKQENKQLKQRLRINDQKVIQLQIKLTRILQQHQGQVGTLQNTMKYYEMKEQIQRKERQIEKMNQQFCYEIQKYNVVYETLKKQLEEYKSYESNIETVQLIEKLQTQIVVLREEKDRQQMINEELRKRLNIVANVNLGPIHKPTYKNRDLSRTQYVNHSNDLYNPSLDQYYYERESLQYDTENDLSDPQIGLSVGPRYVPNSRDYSRWIGNDQLANDYRY